MLVYWPYARKQNIFSFNKIFFGKLYIFLFLYLLYIYIVVGWTATAYGAGLPARLWAGLPAYGLPAQSFWLGPSLDRAGHNARPNTARRGNESVHFPRMQRRRCTVMVIFQV